jgi:hypothetical protein
VPGVAVAAADFLMNGLPPAEADYLAAVVHKLRTHMGAALVGVYPTGSVALGAYRAGRSDLDLIAVLAQPPSPSVLRDLAAQLRHEVLPCPAAGLELVVYPQQTVSTATVAAGYLLDLNTGRDLTTKVSLNPDDGPQFWYSIDRAVTRQAGVRLMGPSVPDLFATVPFDALLDVVIESVRAHREAIAEHGDNGVLNACRALRFGVERRWYAKESAADWAASVTPEFGALIGSAAASYAAGRAAGRSLPGEAVSAFLTVVLARLSDIAAVCDLPSQTG